MTKWNELIDALVVYCHYMHVPKDVHRSHDKIKELKASLSEVEQERDALKEAMRWIPVEERLPEEGEYVSVLFGKDEKTVGSWFTETETEEYETIGFEYKQWEVWNFGENKFKYVDNPPTHWMPLPAVPERDVK